MNKSIKWLPYAMIVALLSLLMIIASSATFYPGLMTYDSLRQYEQAVFGHFTDRHPPLMSLLWRGLNTISSGPQSFLAFNQILYWLSFALMSLYVWQVSRRWISIFVIGVGLFPLLLNFSGVIWKDVVLAVFWALYVGLILVVSANRLVWPRIGLYATLAFALLVLFFGSVMRYNAFPAAAALALAPCCILLHSWRNRLAAWSTLVLLLAGAPLATNRILNAEPTHPLIQVAIFDLAGISVQTGRNYLLPGSGTDATLLSCYSPQTWEVFAYNQCLPLQEEFARITEEDPGYLASWLKGILAEPLAYVTHRLWYFAELMRFGCSRCKPYIWVDRTDSNDLGFSYEQKRLFRWLRAIVYRLDITPLTRPYFWLIASLGLCAYHLRKEQTHQSLILALISLSGSLYLLSYFVAGIADDFRYAYWTILAVASTASVAILTASKPVHCVYGISRYIVPPAAAAWLLDLILRWYMLIDPLNKPVLKQIVDGSHKI